MQLLCCNGDWLLATLGSCYNRGMKVIFAQGNPGAQYANTRHNVGFFVVDALAKSEAAEWRVDKKFGAAITELTLENDKVLLVKPLSFYNETGLVARRILDFYKLDPASDLLVIHDELALPFGTIRVREKGSDAGNNGIKSLNAHLGDAYWRIRLGIAPQSHPDSLIPTARHVSFVLSSFNQSEASHLDDTLIPAVFKYIRLFLTGALTNHSENNEP